ncbi:MAG: zinc-finger domain-containing protein [Alphaproteobacteria bacterium]
MDSDKTITVTESPVACDGGGALGHPLVYLNLGEAGESECPYCGLRFKLEAGAGTGH